MSGVSNLGQNDSDGKSIVVISPATEGMKTWLTSRGDDVAQGPAGRGRGTPIRVDFDGTETFPITKDVLVPFYEPIEVHDGQFNWTPGSFNVADYFSVSVYIPPSVATSTPGTGNVNEVPIGGGAILYVPAAGDGSHTIDLEDFTKAVPIPANDDGYWDVDAGLGSIAPGAKPGQAGFHLGNFPVEPFLIVEISMQNSIGLFDIDVYKTEWVHQAWKVRLSVTKTTTGAGTASGWLLVFRKNVTRL